MEYAQFGEIIHTKNGSHERKGLCAVPPPPDACCCCCGSSVVENVSTTEE